ncbi:MAG: MFS transporter [Dehalococcoidia bacterium]|nr:MFS transporter [Dehalococcoidia bacterium]
MTNTRGDNYQWVALFAISLSVFTTVMDFSGITVALPTIADDLDLSLPAASWIILASTLTIIAVLVPAASLSDRFGRKLSYILGLVLFGGGAIGVAVSPSFELLIAARIVQSAGIGIIQTNSYAIIATVFPDDQRGKGIGAYTSVVGLAAITGPIVGGVVVEALGWRFFFIIAAGLAAIAVVAGFRLLHASRVNASRKTPGGPSFDWFGAVLSGTMLAVLIAAINTGSRIGWDSPWIIGAFPFAVLLAALFVWRELDTDRPMLDLRVFANAPYSWSMTTRFLGFLSGSGWRFLMPFYLQEVRGFQPSQVGLLVFSSAVGMAIFSYVSGRLADRFGTRRWVIFGLAIIVGVSLFYSTLDETTPIAIIVAVLFITGMGLGMWEVPNTTSALDVGGNASTDTTGALVNVTRNAGNITSIAISSSIVTGVLVARGLEPDLSLVGNDSTGAMADAFLDGARAVYIALAIVAVVGILAAWRVVTRNKQAEPPPGRSGS